MAQARKPSGKQALPGGVKRRPPPFRAVQLATLVDAVPSGDRWLHEMKYDGYRSLIAVGGGEARAYARNAGLRIDHLLLSAPLAKRLVDAQVDRHVRGWEKTSDHAPTWVELKDE